MLLACATATQAGKVDMRYFAVIVTTTSTSTSTTTTTLTAPTEVYWITTGRLVDGDTDTSMFHASADKMRCMSIVPVDTITDADRLIWRTGAGGSGSGVFGVGIYNKHIISGEGTVLLMSGTVTYSATNTVYTASLFPTVNLLQPGIEYFLCFCSSVTASRSYASLTSDLAGPGNSASRADILENIFGTIRQGVAANSCATGVPPNTTGAVTAEVYEAPLFLLGVP